MIIYGIDPAADSFTAAQYGESGATRYDHAADGVASFIASLPQRADLLVAVENTGVYGEALCYALHEAGIAVVLLDPHAIWRAFPGTPKTDPLDSAKVAEYAHRYLDRLVRWRPHEAIVEQVRVLLKTREQLVRQRTALANTLQTLRRKVVQTPAANEAIETVAEQLRMQIRALEAELRRLIGQHPTLSSMVSLLLGVPGVGLLLSAQLLVLTSGFTEIPHYRKLAQRLGVAPNPYRSGTSVYRPDRSRGFGPPEARKLLHLAARSQREHHPYWRAYYERKVATGKAGRLVLNNIVNRQLRIICAILRDQVPYHENHISIHPSLLTKS